MSPLSTIFKADSILESCLGRIFIVGHYAHMSFSIGPEADWYAIKATSM